MLRRFQFLPRVVLYMLVMFAAAMSQAQITPGADAYTNSAAPTTNYGSNPLLEVEGASQTSFIQFNLSSIPTGASVSQATLKLYVNGVTTPGSFNVDYVNGAWSESTITHNLSPAIGSTIVAGVPITAADTNQYILINITPAVVAWLKATQANDGVALVANGSFNASFDSKENTTTSHPAELDVVFSGGTITGVTTAVGSGLAGGGTSGTLKLSLISTCPANQVLKWSGSAWACSAVGTGTITGVTTANGSGLTGGGTSGTLALGLLNSCSSGQVLRWSGTSWACSAVGTGTITGVTAGTDLTGGGTSGGVTLNLDTSKVPQLSAANTFTGNQTVNGNLSATGAVTGATFNIGSNLFAFGSSLNFNAFLGFAGNSTMTGGGNTALGAQALVFNTTGAGNTAGGEDALVANTTGGSNTALGVTSLNENRSGNFNTGVGESALYHNYTGSFNTGVGADSDLGGSLSYATAIGAQAVVNANNSTAIGANAFVSISNALVLGAAGTSVGIGINAPAATLDVPGYKLDTYVGNPGCGANPFAGIAFGSTGFQSCGNYSMVGDGVNTYVAAPTGAIYFRTNKNATTAMTIAANGDVNILGSLSKGSGSFKIDDPLDPANKYLYHSFVESPDMMDVYNGNITTNQRGIAVVTLPEYFQALNRDFRYQLTVIGQFAQAIVAKEIRHNQFEIKTNHPGVKVSWQVTGIRHDAFADAHRIPVEQPKPPEEQGKYLHPELFGASPEQAVGYSPGMPSNGGAHTQIATGTKSASQ